jgi:hypothetical protein
MGLATIDNREGTDLCVILVDNKKDGNEEQGCTKSTKKVDDEPEKPSFEEVDDFVDDFADDFADDFDHINDFVNADLEQEIKEKEDDYKQYIRNILKNESLSIHVDQDKNMHDDEGEDEGDDEEFELDSISNKALDTKQINQNIRDLDDPFSKSNFPLQPHLVDDNILDSNPDRFPGTAPDLEPDLQKYANVLTKFDSNIEDFLNEADEPELPENFGEMFHGQHRDIEKVVYFSTLNSNEKDDYEVEIKLPKRNPEIK